MPIKVTCPKCQGVLHAPDDAGGKKGKCPTCGTVLAIPAAGSGPGTMPSIGFGGGGMIPPEPEDVLAATPFKAPPMNRSMPDDGRRASFATNAPPFPLPPTGPGADRSVRASSTFGSQPNIDARKPGDPFAKKGRTPAKTDSEQTVNHYRRGRSGLWWCMVAYFLFFAAIVAYAGIQIAEMNGVKLPSANPGFLKIDDLSQDTEIRIAAVLLPAALGALLLTLGRVGASGVPSSSFARGTLKLSALATFLTLLGLIAAAVVTGSVLANNLPPQLVVADDVSGMIQRGGLAVAAVFAPLAELLFIIGLARLGSGLQNERLSGRGTRFLFLLSFGYVVASLLWYAVSMYGSEINRAITSKVAPKINDLGDKKALIVPVLIIVVALLVYMVYVRLLGAARLAIRDRLDSIT